jgi:hypothetical protein
MIGKEAIQGAIERIVAVSESENRKLNWESQWGNWDDLGGDDPGWGDVGD